MGLKAKIEAIIYAAEEPITLEQISLLVKDIVLAEEAAAKARSDAESTAAPLDAADQSEFVAEQPIAIGGEDSDLPNADSQAIAELATKLNAEPATPTEAQDTPPAESAPLDSASVEAPEPTRGKKRKAESPKKELSEDARVRAYLRPIIEQLMAEYQQEDRGIEIRQIAGGYKMATKPEHHDVVRAFARSLKPPVRLSLAALETLAVIAYKQPVTVPEISEIRGVEAGGVIGTLLDRKLITTAGRKQVIGRPILYKTSKDFLMRFGLNDISELPSMEEFEKLASDGQGDLFTTSAPTEPTVTAAQQEQNEEERSEREDAAEAEASANTSDEPEKSAAGNS